MTDDRMDQIIGNLLRIGVLSAAGVVFAGGVWYLASNGMKMPDYQHIHSETVQRSMSSPGLIWAGLLILVATPVARVIFSLVAFWLNRDRTYVWITAIVLAVLLYSIVVGSRL